MVRCQGYGHALASVHACTHSEVKSGSAYMYKVSGAIGVLQYSLIIIRHLCS